MNSFGMWEVRAEYADGTSLEKYFPYYEDENENERQYDLECYAIKYHDDCTWYSVNYVDPDIVELLGL